jgi:hypothetical protein
MILTRADITRCLRCNLDRSFCIVPGEGVVQLCVCCAPRFQNGTLLDCAHPVPSA